MPGVFRNLFALMLLALILQACGKEPGVEQPSPVPTADVAAPAVAVAVAAPPPIDPVTGFKMASDWELVRNNCIGCHQDEPGYGGVSGPELYTAWERLQPSFIASWTSAGTYTPLAWL